MREQNFTVLLFGMVWIALAAPLFVFFQTTILSEQITKSTDNECCESVVRRRSKTISYKDLKQAVHLSVVGTRLLGSILRLLQDLFFR